MIACSTYLYQENRTYLPSAPEGAVELCRRVLKSGFAPGPMFVLDIAGTPDGQFGLLEANAFSTAALYACRMDPIVKRAGEDPENRPGIITNANSNLKRIVITGGACAGKSTGLVPIQVPPASLGWNPVIVPEAATLVFKGAAGFPAASRSMPPVSLSKPTERSNQDERRIRKRTQNGSALYTLGAEAQSRAGDPR